MQASVIILVIQMVILAIFRALYAHAIIGNRPTRLDPLICTLLYLCLTMITEGWILYQDLPVYTVLLVRIVLLAALVWSTRRCDVQLIMLGSILPVLIDFVIENTIEMFFVAVIGRTADFYLGYSKLYDSLWMNLVVAMPVVGINTAMYLLFRKYMQRLGRLNKRPMWILSGFNFVLICITGYISDLSFSWLDMESRMFITISFLFFLIMVILLLFMIVFTGELELNEQKNEVLMLSTLNHSAKAGYEIVIQKNDEQRKAIHDFRNYLLAIQSMEPDSVPSFVSDILDNKLPSSAKAFCKDPYIDAVISSKQSIITESEIRFHCSIVMTEDLDRISPSDLCSIISNQLDNAIDACLKINNQDERWINYVISQKGNMTVFTCENSILPHSIQKGEALSTTKNQTNHMHGYGLKNIERAANKYSGSSKYEVRDNSFLSTVMIRHV